MKKALKIGIMGMIGFMLFVYDDFSFVTQDMISPILEGKTND